MKSGTQDIVAIDVGNSRIKAGLFSDRSSRPLPLCSAAIAVPVTLNDPAAAIGEWLGHSLGNMPNEILVGGVNPPAIARLRDNWQSRWGNLKVLLRPAATALTNQTEVPDRVGHDRLFDAVAVNAFREPGRPAIVIDSGTATTVDWINPKGAFCGGAILPGFETLATALHERTALLPRIEIPSGAIEPVGRNTAQAVQSGLYWGLVGGVKELIEQMSASTATQPLVVLTGGASSLLEPHLHEALLRPHLTLQGIVLSARCLADL